MKPNFWWNELLASLDLKMETVRLIGYDGVRLMSQNCGHYGSIAHPRVICDVDLGMIKFA
jgi:hypothetical protein